MGTNTDSGTAIARLSHRSSVRPSHGWNRNCYRLLRVSWALAQI